jgi:hypothetical protein
LHVFRGLPAGIVFFIFYLNLHKRTANNPNKKEMKKIVMLVSVAIASISFSYAQQGQQQQRGQQQQEERQRGQQQDRGQQERGQQQRGMQQGEEGMAREIERGDKNQIDRNELPGSVQNSLRTGEFSEWEVDEVYRVQPEARRETGVAFEVRVKRGNEKMSIHYDQNGNVIGQQRKDKGDKERGREGTERRGRN